jgi:PTS system galactitol-specific IIB component
MYKVKILVVCGSGVATSMTAAFKLREYLEEQKVPAVIDGAGNNELDMREGAYDIIISNTIVTTKTNKPVFNAVPLLTGIGEKELVTQVIEAAKKIQAQKG